MVEVSKLCQETWGRRSLAQMETEGTHRALEVERSCRMHWGCLNMHTEEEAMSSNS